MRMRILIFVVVIIFLFSLDIVRIIYITGVKGAEYSAKAESQQLSDTEIPAMRGTIYDCDGNVLAQSATVWNIFLDPSNIKDEETRTVVVDNLAKILKLDEKGKEELLQNTKKKTRYVIIAKKIENDVKEEISSFVSAKENKKYKLSTIIGTEQTTRRYYPYGSFASSVIGFTGSDNQGLSGIESYYNEKLTGTNGRIITVKDANSNNLPTDYETSVDAIDGNSLVLTINQNIQYYLEKNLRETLEEYQCKGAYGIVMNCNTGAVLAMASLPDYDCNEPYKITYNKTKKDIKKIKDKKEKAQEKSNAIQNQWRNFTVSDTYEPGSVFKVFTASAALEENVVNMNTTYTCSGSIQVKDKKMNCHNHAGHGTQTLKQGLENSCNPFFITIGQRLGVKNYFKYFQAFGFTEKTGIDLPGEASPQYYKENQYGIVELSSAAFGQTNSLTPIEVCSGIAAVANGGTLLKPYVVSEIKDANGNTVSKTEKTEVRRVISEDTAQKVRSMMKYIVSFAAIAPSDDPQIAMLIVCDEPNQDLGGGALCAPIAAQVIEQTMTELNIEPRYTESESKKLSITTPNTVGSSVDAAKAALKAKNLECKVVGKGDMVLSQSPSSNTTVPSGGVVVLYTEKNSKKTTTVPNFKGLTISEANSLAAQNNINIEISGNNLTSSNVVAYSQSTEKGTKVEIGAVITVKFKSTVSVLD